MSCCDEALFQELQRDLTSHPMRISAYHDLPFAMLAYDPSAEFECRSFIRRLAISLEEKHGRRVTFISLAELVWKAISETEGVQAIIEEERQFGFDRAQETVNRILSDNDFAPLAKQVLERMAGLDPAVDIVFLVRPGALAPAIYRRAKLLDELHGQTRVPIILFYPGSPDEQGGLRFMGLSHQQYADVYNYRVKIYGGQ
jgi:BREX protein BrxB